MFCGSWQYAVGADGEFYCERRGETQSLFNPSAGIGAMFVLANSAFAPLAGDFNANGVVDAADYTVWREAMETSTFTPLADGNRDGRITWADAEVWRTHFGQTRMIAPVTTPVPEPSALVLALLVAWVLRPERKKAR